MKILNRRICRSREGEIVLDNDGLVICKCDDGTMLSISLDTIKWEADILQYENEDTVYLISTKPMPIVVPSLSSFTSEFEPLESDKPEKDLLNQRGEKRKKTPYIWSNSASKLLLNLYQTYHPMISQRKIKTFKKMWEKITEELKEKGYDVDVDQAENRFKTLKRNYVDTKHHNKQTENGRKTCAYEDELQVLLGKRHNINPVVTSDRTGIHISSSNTVNSFDRDISKVSDGIEENIYDPNTSPSSSDSPYPSINNEICRERPKTITTASGLQLCNQSLQQIKNALSTRHVERQQFENKLLEKYTEETE
ncbi:trihelix transcription factor ASIL1-like, partial [Aphis craccivora]